MPVAGDREAFAAARRFTDRQAANRFLAEHGVHQHGEQAAALKAAYNHTPFLLPEGVRRLSMHALSQALGPTVSTITCTVWPSVTTTWGGARFTVPWQGYGIWHSVNARAMAAKGDGFVYNPTSNCTGYRANESTEAMYALNLDCDGTGDWFELWSIIDGLGMATLMHRSGGYQPGLPKWRLTLPLAQPVITLGPASVLWWRLGYSTARTVFGSLGRLLGPGFDPATDGPHHPWYPGSRRTVDAPPREVVQRTGRTLDLFALVASLPPPEMSVSTSTPNSGLSATPSLLELAFEEAGMLGHDLGNGRRAVICPWNDSHTQPLSADADPTSSTVIFGGRSGPNLGAFACAHSCGNQSVDSVLDALPPEAVARARAPDFVQVERGPSATPRDC
jgi:hypothetical protein